MHWLIKKWSGWSLLTIALLPLSFLFLILISIRRALYKYRVLSSSKPDLPVIVVGNIFVGGTGKTPLVIWLADFLKNKGYRPGILSRGYGGDSSKHPILVTDDSTPEIVGDEPKLIYEQTKCPLIVGSKRSENAQRLKDEFECDIIISDDGLQSYSLARDIEIIVFDGRRGYGNGVVFPAGPLREPKSRIKDADFVLLNGGSNTISGFNYLIRDSKAVNLISGEERALDSFAGDKVHAVAGIGNPNRFFDGLRKAGIEVIEHPFPDHMKYDLNNLSFTDDYPVLMTEKDSIKCSSFASENWWAVTIDISIEKGFIEQFESKLRTVSEIIDEP